MKYKIIIILFSLFLYSSCEEETNFDPPVVFTGDATNVDQTKAILNAKIFNPENIPITESGFIWGLHSMDKNDIKILNSSIEDTYSLQTNYDLLPGKHYYARAFVKSANNIVYGREVSFKTDSLPLNLGKWTKISEFQDMSNEKIQSSFSHKNSTFFILKWGEIYRFNHFTNKIDFTIYDINLSNCSFSCEYQNNAYIFVDDAFYKMDLMDFKITKLREWGTNKKYGCSGFLIDDNIYVGLGRNGYMDNSKEVWKYNISLDEWTKIEDFPGAHRIEAFSFTINGIWYLGGGLSIVGDMYFKQNDFWSYNSATNKWLQKETLPTLPNYDFQVPGTSSVNFGYCVVGKSFLEFNPIFNIWEKMKNISETEEYLHPFLFNYNNNIFLIEFISYNVPTPSGYTKWVDFKLSKYEK